jgi:hypothetical protein
MKLLPILAAVSAYGLAGCASQAAHEHDHWGPYSVQSSLSRAFLSYDPEMDGSYREFQWRKKRSINLTLRRHLFNENPDNPFEAEDPTWYEPRPVNSIVPHPWDYIHVEGLVLGLAVYTPGAVFVPIPVDSIIATFEDGGDKEFMDGIAQTTRPVGAITTSFFYDGLGFVDNRKLPQRSIGSDY